MNDSSKYSFSSAAISLTPTGQFADRALAMYSLLLILVGTPSNLLCCCIYLQKNNRSNSIKTIFGYLALLDTIVLYTFNLNYVVREFTAEWQFSSPKLMNRTMYRALSDSDRMHVNVTIVKKNLEEYSLFICRSLSYLGEREREGSLMSRFASSARISLLAFSTLQTSSWILVFGSLNRYLLIRNITQFDFICKRHYTMRLCLCLTCFFFLANIHILWMNGYRSATGTIICYQHQYYRIYMQWYQRVHLCLYCVLPSIILFVLNTLLMKTIFASKKRLKNHQRSVDNNEPASSRRRHVSFGRLSSTMWNKSARHCPRRTLNRHSRKLTLSLIFITLSYFILTFPSTVIFSFFRSYIEPIRLRRTLSLLFTNLSTTTHAIRFFIYFICSIDFRNDFYRLCASKRLLHRLPFSKENPPHQAPHSEQPLNSINRSEKH